MKKLIMTQEKKNLLKSINPTGTEQLTSIMQTMKPSNYLEKQIISDLKDTICKGKEKELREALDESGVFYFYQK